MTLSQFIADSKTHAIPLTWDGAAFEPADEWILIFTAKHALSDADADAVFQKTSGAGITVAASTAIVTTVPDDTAAESYTSLYYDIRAQEIATGARRTLASGRFTLLPQVTQETTTSTPVHTTEPPLPISTAVEDGNKGSITVSASGATWTINSGAVTNAMLAGSIADGKISSAATWNAKLNSTGGTATNLTLAGTLTASALTTDNTTKTNLRNAAGLGTADSPTFTNLTATGMFTMQFMAISGVDAPAIAANKASVRTELGLGFGDSPRFTGLTVTGTAVIPNASINTAIATDPAATRAAVLAEEFSPAKYFRGGGLASLRTFLDGGMSADVAIISDSTGTGTTTGWVRYMLNTLAAEYPTHGIYLDTVTANAGKAYARTTVQAAPSGERYHEWQPESPTAWGAGNSYVVGDWVTQSAAVYYCIAAHTSAVADTPGSGINTATYWLAKPYYGNIRISPDDVPYLTGDGATTSTAKKVHVEIDFVLPLVQTPDLTLWMKGDTIVATTGRLRIDVRADGRIIFFWTDTIGSSSYSSSYSTASLLTVIARGDRVRLKVTFDPDNGANRLTNFYTSVNGAAYVQLGSTVSHTVTQFVVPKGPMLIGASGGSNINGYRGLKFYGCTVRQGIDGPIDCNMPVDLYQYAPNIHHGVLRGSPVLRVQNFSWGGLGTPEMDGLAVLTGSTYIVYDTDFYPGNTVAAIISLGHNDNANESYAAHGLNWIASIASIAGKISARCPRASIVTVAQNPKISTDPYILDQYEKAALLSQKARREGWTFVDIMRMFRDYSGGADALISDGTHPTVTGNTLWAATMVKGFDYCE